jgi:hypothetical protein
MTDKLTVKGSTLLFIVSFLTYLFIVYYGCTSPVTSEEAQQPPRNLSATFTGTAVNLTWDASERNEETGYEVWRSVGNNSNYEKLATVDEEQHSYTDDGIDLDKTYYYKVRTVYGADPGKFSNEVSVYTCSFYVWSVENSFTVETQKIYKLNPGTGDVVNSFNSPGFWPTGLAWDGTYLWVVDFVDIHDKIYKLDPSNGSVVSSVDSPDGLWSGQGLAWDGTYLLYAGEDPNGPGFKIYKINPSNGNIMSSFDSPSDSPSGLAWDGTYLWNADYSDYKIYKLNPSDGSIVSSFDSPGERPHGLAWDGTYLWNSDYSAERVFKIDPNTGKVVTSFRSPGICYPWGLAIQ